MSVTHLPKGTKAKFTITGTVKEYTNYEHDYTHEVTHDDGHHSYIYLGGDDAAVLDTDKNKSVTVEVLESSLVVGEIYIDNADDIARWRSDGQWELPSGSTRVREWMHSPVLLRDKFDANRAAAR
jgi:hypothetical protein